MVQLPLSQGRRYPGPSPPSFSLEERRSPVGDFDLHARFEVAPAAATICFTLNEPVPLVDQMCSFRMMELLRVPRHSPSILAIFALVIPYP